MIDLISSIYNSANSKKSYEAYWQNTDISYNINRIKNGILDIIHTPNEEEDIEEKQDYNEFYLGKFQTWYVGKELNSIGNLTNFNASQNLSNQTIEPIVNQTIFDNTTGKYEQSDAYGIYNDTKSE